MPEHSEMATTVQNVGTDPVQIQTHIRIEPPRGLPSVGFRELFEYRELLYFLVWGNIKVRYKQTVLGGAWAIRAMSAS